jgi:hypothetical protein
MAAIASRPVDLLILERYSGLRVAGELGFLCRRRTGCIAAALRPAVHRAEGACAWTAAQRASDRLHRDRPGVCRVRFCRSRGRREGDRAVGVAALSDLGAAEARHADHLVIPDRGLRSRRQRRSSPPASATAGDHVGGYPEAIVRVDCALTLVLIFALIPPSAGAASRA